MLNSWQMINETNYDLTLEQPKEDSDSGIVKLEKKNVEADEEKKIK